MIDDDRARARRSLPLVVAGVCLAAWPAAAARADGARSLRGGAGRSRRRRGRASPRRPMAAPAAAPAGRRSPRRCGRSIATRRFVRRYPRQRLQRQRALPGRRSRPARSTPPTDAAAHRELVTKYVDLAGPRISVELAAHRGAGDAAQRRGRARGLASAGPSRLAGRRRGAARARPRRQRRPRRRAGVEAPRAETPAARPPRRRRPSGLARPPGDRARPCFPTSCGSRCRSIAR